MIFSLFDIKAEVFGPLFEARTPDEAKRLFISVLLSDSSSNVARYPQDHQLYCLGEFDNATGNLDVTAPNMILTGMEACQLCNNYKNDVKQLFNSEEVKNVDTVENTNDS